MLENHYHKGKLVDPRMYNSVRFRRNVYKIHNDLKTESLFAFEIKAEMPKANMICSDKFVLNSSYFSF